MAAAALLLVSGALMFHAMSGERDPEARLAAAVAELARDHPERFREFTPLSRAERLAPAEEVYRGGPAALLPAGTVGETRPVFRWEGGEGIASWTITLRRQEDGAVLWSASASGSPTAYPAERPPLVPGGRYLWEAAAEGPGGAVHVRRAFAVAGEEDEAAFAEALRAVDASPAARRVAPLVKAHFALRRGRPGDAERFAREAAAAAPGDPVARQTLLRALTILGAAEAEGMRREEERNP